MTTLPPAVQAKIEAALPCLCMPQPTGGHHVKCPAFYRDRTADILAGEIERLTELAEYNEQVAHAALEDGADQAARIEVLEKYARLTEYWNGLEGPDATERRVFIDKLFPAALEKTDG